MIPPQGQGIRRLSELLIDINKDWGKYNITNFGAGGVDLYSMLTAHASRHAYGGADEVSLDASQITSGVLSLDRIPTIPYTKTDFADQALKTTSNVRFATVSVGDLEFRNGWRIAEDERYGLVLISPSGRKFKFALEAIE